MKGYGQQHLTEFQDDPEAFDALMTADEMSDDVLLEDDIEANEGRMSRADIIKAFGPDAAGHKFGKVRSTSKSSWKRRAPFAPKRIRCRSEPWFELQTPAGLPSFKP